MRLRQAGRHGPDGPPRCAGDHAAYLGITATSCARRPPGRPTSPTRRGKTVSGLERRDRRRHSSHLDATQLANLSPHSRPDRQPFRPMAPCLIIRQGGVAAAQKSATVALTRRARWSSRPRGPRVPPPSGGAQSIELVCSKGARMPRTPPTLGPYLASHFGNRQPALVPFPRRGSAA